MKTTWILVAAVGLLLLCVPASADEAPYECGWLFPEYADGDTLLEVPHGFGVPVAGEFSAGWNCPEDHGWGLIVVVTDPEGQVYTGRIGFRGDAWRPSAFVWTPDLEMELGVAYTMHIEHDYTFPDSRTPTEKHNSTLQFEFVDTPIELPDASVEIWASLDIAVSGCCAERELDGTCAASDCELTSSATLRAVIEPVPAGIAPYVGWRLHYASDVSSYQLAQGEASTERLTIERTIDGEGPFAPHRVALELFIDGNSESTVTLSDRQEADAEGDECSYVDIPDCDEEDGPSPDPDEPGDLDDPVEPQRADPEEDESVFDEADPHARGTSGCMAAGRPSGWNLLLRR